MTVQALFTSPEGLCSLRLGGPRTLDLHVLFEPGQGLEYPTITIDLSGLDVDEPVTPAARGYELAGRDGGRLTFAPIKPFHRPLAKGLVTLRLNRLRVGGPPRLVMIPVEVDGSSVRGRFQEPLVLLGAGAPSLPEGAVSWARDPVMEVVPSRPLTRRQSLTLRWRVETQGSLFLALPPNEVFPQWGFGPAAYLSDLVVEVDGGQVAPLGLGLWQLTPPAGAKALTLRLRNLPTMQRKGTARLELIACGGEGEGVVATSVRKVSASISFTESLTVTTVTSPASFLVSWSISGANTVVLTTDNAWVSNPADPFLGVVRSSDQLQFNGETTCRFTIVGYSASFGVMTGASAAKPPSWDAMPGLVPSGAIMPWNGVASQVPGNFALCDGGTYTSCTGSTMTSPDLVNYFIIGAGADATSSSTTQLKVGAVYSGDSHAHNFTFSSQTLAENGSHSHGLNSVFRTSGPTEGGFEDLHWVYKNPASWKTESYNLHPHKISGGDIPTDKTAFMPPYYKLCYIVKR